MEILLKQGGLMVRNTYNFDCQEETCFWNVIKDQFEGLEELVVKDTKKSDMQKGFEYRQIDLMINQEKGYPIS